MQSSLLVVGSFLLGSLPFSYWVARWRSGADLRTVGSGNPGATNVLRVAGKGPAAVALLLDVAKGFMPVAAAVELGERPLIVASVAVAAICGHILSPLPRPARWQGCRDVSRSPLGSESDRLIYRRRDLCGACTLEALCFSRFHRRRGRNCRIGSGDSRCRVGWTGRGGRRRSYRGDCSPSSFPEYQAALGRK